MIECDYFWRYAQGKSIYRILAISLIIHGLLFQDRGMHSKTFWFRICSVMRTRAMQSFKAVLPSHHEISCAKDHIWHFEKIAF